MYIDKESGLEIFETVSELINNEIIGAWEYNNKYYIRVKLKDNYDNRLWVVDKVSLRVSDMFFTDFFEIMDKATPVDPNKLKELLK